jgi:hypothetical protein
MPVDLGSTIKKTSRFIFSSNLLNNILGSSLFLSILISIFMLLVVMINYPAKSGTPISVLCKLFIYMFFGSLAFIFLHDGIIKNFFEEEEMERQENDVLQGTNSLNQDIVYGKTMIDPTIKKPDIKLMSVQKKTIEEPPKEDIQNTTSDTINIGSDRLNGIKLI